MMEGARAGGEWWYFVRGRRGGGEDCVGCMARGGA